MKNVMEKSAQFESQVASSQQEMSQELFDPQEWESLLNSFEDGSQSAAASTHVNSGEIELSSDDLWERLSSTRWLREQVSDRESTITQRPMD